MGWLSLRVGSMADPIFSCTTCNGAGRVADDVICPDCLGGGSLPLRGMPEMLKSIIDEQASQRTELTQALQAIWNKVKDL